MSIQSRIRVLWGVLGLLVSLLLLSLAYGATAGDPPAAAPALSSVNEPPHAATVRRNLAKLANAIYWYRVANRDELPTRLSMVYPTYISDPTVFWNPGDSDPCPTTIDNDEPDQPNSTQVSFHYVGSERLVLQDNSLSNNAGAGVYAILDRPRAEFYAVAEDPPAFTEATRANLQQIGHALNMYAGESDGRFPDRLSMVFPHPIPDPTVFWSPGDRINRVAPITIDNDAPDRVNSAQMSYHYGAVGHASSAHPQTILVLDNSPSNNHGAVLNFVCADLTVTTCIQTVSCSVPPQCSAISQYNLARLGSAIANYRAMNNDWLPTDLSMLYHMGLIQDPMVFWTPGDSDPSPLLIDNDVPNQLNSTQISYAYLREDSSIDELSIVLQDHSLANAGGAGFHALTVDGQSDLFEPSSRWLPSSVVARVNLQQIGQALQAYAADYSGQFPPKLSLLFPTYISDPTMFWNPGDKNPCPTAINMDTPNKTNSAQISFNYLGASYTTACEPGVILVSDNSLGNNGGTGLNVLTADLQVTYFAPTPPSCGYLFNCTSVARSNLARIAWALQSYAYSNQSLLPTRLSMLYPNSYYAARPTVFWHPGDTDPWPITINSDQLNQEDSAQISFEYLAAGRKLWEMEPDEILLRDNTPANNGGNGRLVLYADGHVGYVPIRMVTSIAISGPDAVPEGGSAQYTCIATYDDDTTQDVTASSFWFAYMGVGSVSETGGYTAPAGILTNTFVTLEAYYYDEQHREIKATRTITVQNTVRIPTSLTISSGPATVAEDGSASYTCTVTYDDGGTQNVTADAAWSVTSGPGSFSSPGTYAAPPSVLGDTPATIRATYSEAGVTLQADKDITVLNSIVRLTGLSISSGPDTVPESGSAPYTATATYDDGTTQNVTTAAVWSVIAGPGAFSGTTAGLYVAPPSVTADTPVTLRASYSIGGITQQAQKSITVLNTIRFLTSVSISAEPVGVPQGGSAQYACTAHYDDTTTQDVTALAVWSVPIGPGTFTQPGLYVAPASVATSTSVQINALYTQQGTTRQATKNITVYKPGVRELTGVAITSGPAVVPEGGTGQYVCTAYYSDGSNDDVTTTASWYVIGSPQAFPAPGAYAAPVSVLADTPVTLHVIYVQGGVSKQASKGIVVQNSVRRLNQVAIHAGPDAVAEGAIADYTCVATYDDGSTQSVTAAATWAVASGPGSFTSPGTYAAPASVPADTSATLRASHTEGGVTKQAVRNITIKNTFRTLTGLAISTGPTTLQAGGTASYTCTATYDDGTTQQVTASATWTVISGPGSFASAGAYAAPASLSASTTAVIQAHYAERNVTKAATKNIIVQHMPPPVADADGDGVPDSHDLCLATPGGAAVDADGCAASQKQPDRDADGIPDDLDGCPDDPRKTSPGDCGCGIAESACAAPPMYTVRVLSPSGSPAPSTYPSGTWAQIAAPAAPEGTQFSHWSGDLTGSDNPAKIYVDADKEIVANYESCPLVQTPCGPGVPACGLITLLALALVKRIGATPALGSVLGSEARARRASRR